MKKIKIIILLFLILSLSFGLYNIFKIHKELSNAEEIKEELIELVEIPEEPSEEPTFEVDFEELKKINSNVVGWIVIDSTQINYPIVQGDDNDYYLNHSFDKKWNSLGSIFMDYQSSNDFSDYNTFIYGHHTKNGSMFGEIYKYMDYNFYLEHPTFNLYTPNGNYVVEILSASLDKASSDSYNQTFNSLEEYNNYLDLIIGKSNYKTDSDIDYKTDKIITLYSCSHESNRAKNDRYFIHGIMRKV